MTKKTGKLNFEVKFSRPNEIQNIDLPVEIRRANLSLVKTGLSSEQMELEPGNYFVISKMPAGQELLNQVEVKADKINLAVLKPQEDEESPHESEAVQHYFVADRQKVLAALEKKAAIEEDFPRDSSQNLWKISTFVQIRCFVGNLLTGKIEQIRVDWQNSESEEGLYGFRVNGKDKIQIVQLLQNDAPPLNMILPAIRDHYCKLFITSLIQGKYTFDAHLEDQTADMMLRYSNKGYDWQTELLGAAVDAEELLRGKKQNPLSAAVGAYSLLRFNNLEMLHDWTENLRNWFKWLPDGSAIRGEHLARLGEHKEALRAFLELQERGVPIFSDGLSYTTDRLARYIELKSDFIDSSTREKSKNLLTNLQKITNCADFREPFTTFTGSDIKNPSAEPINKITKDNKALDLTQLVS